ncbi:hypothetical protein Pcinc_012287 [Petrolisthes cinctipes]|uniref:Uncharacterized protein n=1 Tax=Petrolisthes cinctipes TaxID=88211 RepID=A0AAE1KRM1_PETCI|nr:hypothetical protein Pcinc_012287 [Petrolisthes cinctipes]
MIQKVQNTVGAELRKNRGASFCKICSVFLLVRRLAEKDYSAGIEGYWYQYFKRVCSMKEMIIHQKWYKMLFLMHKKMPKVMHMKHKRVCSTKEMIIHQKWY